MKRLINRALDLGVVFLLLFIPTALGNRGNEDEREAPAIASYCDSLCSGERAIPADED